MKMVTAADCLKVPPVLLCFTKISEQIGQIKETDASSRNKTGLSDLQNCKKWSTPPVWLVVKKAKSSKLSCLSSPRCFCVFACFTISHSEAWPAQLSHRAKQLINLNIIGCLFQLALKSSLSRLDLRRWYSLPMMIIKATVQYRVTACCSVHLDYRLFKVTASNLKQLTGDN